MDYLLSRRLMHLTFQPLTFLLVLLAFTTSLYVFIPFVSPFFLHSAWVTVVRNCSYSFFNMHNFLYPSSFCQTCLENPNPWWIQHHLACWIEMVKKFTVVQSKVIIAHGIQTIMPGYSMIFLWYANILIFQCDYCKFPCFLDTPASSMCLFQHITLFSASKQR